ncbi:hypothetical protein BBN63_34430 [Streptomyces niveus]|uniref:Uncharacterized protein n=1 Tax=Streptomyces niveus TaxID=193462 RepID=A0A1U9R242_STRNV|nr:hypothetical protein BBN63_34430 [Streptomyces niveus]
MRCGSVPDTTVMLCPVLECTRLSMSSRDRLLRRTGPGRAMTICPFPFLTARSGTAVQDITAEATPRSARASVKAFSAAGMLTASPLNVSILPSTSSGMPRSTRKPTQSRAGAGVLCAVKSAALNVAICSATSR